MKSIVRFYCALDEKASNSGSILMVYIDKDIDFSHLVLSKCIFLEQINSYFFLITGFEFKLGPFFVFGYCFYYK